MRTIRIKVKSRCRADGVELLNDKRIKDKSRWIKKVSPVSRC